MKNRGVFESGVSIFPLIKSNRFRATRINRMTGPEHLFIHRQTKRVVLLKGIMIDNGVLDKEEFEKSIRMLLGNGSIFFPIIKEQISSNESPEVLLAKIRENYKDSH